MKDNHTFSGAYLSQMFAVYMLRHFSFNLVNMLRARTIHKQLHYILKLKNCSGQAMQQDLEWYLT